MIVSARQSFVKYRASSLKLDLLIGKLDLLIGRAQGRRKRSNVAGGARQSFQPSASSLTSVIPINT
jgi:hypothetical protein